MAEIPDEQVLVVPTAVLRELGYFQGFSAAVDGYLDTLLSPEHTSYQPRAAMEVNPDYKQLIPYVLFCHRDDAGRLAVFRYTRGTGQGERRLHSKHSVGIGGHISALDAAGAEPYAEGMRRELSEEVAINTPYRDSCVGLINDDETEVGKVHLGVVHCFDVESPDVTPREADIRDAGFLPIDQLLANLDGFESWSRICLEALFSREA